MNAPADTRSLSGRTAALALIPLGVLLNLGIGTLVHVLKLPVFLDAVGTLLVTILIGIRWGAIAGSYWSGRRTVSTNVASFPSQKLARYRQAST